ncbi:MAG: TOBE domain-containing protein, partial [Mycetocola sp.]
LLSADGQAQATVLSSSFLGAHRRSVVRLDGGQDLIVQHSASQQLTAGDRVAVSLRPEPVLAV